MKDGYKEQYLYKDIWIYEVNDEHFIVMVKLDNRSLHKRELKSLFAAKLYITRFLNTGAY